MVLRAATERRDKPGLQCLADYGEESEWSRSSRPSKLSFNVGIIAPPRSVLGFVWLCWVTTDTTRFPET